VIFAGLSLFPYTLLHGIFHITDNLTQVVVPGEKDLTLQQKLKYTIFVEEQSVVDGKIYVTRENLNWTGLHCELPDLRAQENPFFVRMVRTNHDAAPNQLEGCPA
jgi:hypothetical protein